MTHCHFSSSAVLREIYSSYQFVLLTETLVLQDAALKNTEQKDFQQLISSVFHLVCSQLSSLYQLYDEQFQKFQQLLLPLLKLNHTEK